MAIATGTGGGWAAPGQGCGYVDSRASVSTYLNSLTWGRDASNCERASLGFSVDSLLSYAPSLVWVSCGTFGGNWVKIWSNIDSKQSAEYGIDKGGIAGSCPGGGGYCCLCGGANYYFSNNGGNFIGSLITDRNTTEIKASSLWVSNSWMSELTYHLPDNLRILPPSNLNASFPSTAGDKVVASWPNWSRNPNIGGTPTSFPYHKIYNVRLELLDERGNYLAQQLKNVGENKSVTFDGMGLFYRSEVLDNAPQASSTRYSLIPGTKYKVRLTINNNMNLSLSKTSELFTVDIPTPKVSIESFLYDPNNKNHSNLNFRWSKASSGADEKITYEVWQNGIIVSHGTLVENSKGLGQSGTKQVVVKSGEVTTVKVFNQSIADPELVKSAQVSAMSPVAGAAFIGYEWDELRHIVKIKATAPGAANTRLRAGYSSNNYDIGDQLTVGEIGEITVENPDHGGGQIIYLEALPEATDGTQYLNEAAKLSIFVPNPILGVTADGGDKHRYVVDIVEHKTDNTVTRKWQNTWPRWVKAPRD